MKSEKSGKETINLRKVFYILPLLIAAYFLVSALWGCGNKTPDTRLASVSETINEDPRAALRRLDSIDASALSNDNRHYYDLLCIKSADKAYITHTSDSLILDVIEYYSKRGDKPLYAEALYYGGRVYSDLGDYPTALRYFHEAIEEIPEGKDNYNLKKRILSQTARLLNSLRLYDEAIPLLKQSIELSKALNDSLKVMYDTQLLGAVNMHMENYDEALRLFHIGRELAVKVSPEDVGQMDVYIAGVSYKKGDIKAALERIRGCVEKSDRIALPWEAPSDMPRKFILPRE